MYPRRVYCLCESECVSLSEGLKCYKLCHVPVYKNGKVILSSKYMLYDGICYYIADNCDIKNACARYVYGKLVKIKDEDVIFICDMLEVCYICLFLINLYIYTQITIYIL